MPDANDIVFNQYSVDIAGLFSVFAKQVEQITGGAINIDILSIVHSVETLWAIVIGLSFLLGAVFLFGFIYASIRFNQLAEIEMERVKQQEELWQQLYGSGASKDSRMADIEQHIASDRPNDWKLAIIEADIILGQILDKAGYAGASIGEQLKSASSHAFKTIDDAWEAHKVRNQIAHEGSDFVLTQKLARETIPRYKRVFAEFGEG